ncbi:MAG: hypothetical protein IIA35_08105, partial [Proteobacteria bacterium]|nr:hypothetical protein [Pseudomonadota bacterium]
MKNVSRAAKFTFLIAGLSVLAACAASGGATGGGGERLFARRAGGRTGVSDMTERVGALIAERRRIGTGADAERVEHNVAFLVVEGRRRQLQADDVRSEGLAFGGH